MNLSLESFQRFYKLGLYTYIASYQLFVQVSCNSNKSESEEEYVPEYEEEQKKLHEVRQNIIVFPMSIDINMQDLSKLVVYCQAKRIKPWSWEEQQQTSVCNMFSFSETAASAKCKAHPKGK